MNNLNYSNYNNFNLNNLITNENNLSIINRLQLKPLNLNGNYYTQIYNSNIINNINQIYPNNNILFYNSINHLNNNINNNNEKKKLNNKLNIQNKNPKNINNINNNNINITKKNDFNNFLQYINSLPLPLINYLCTSKGIFEIQKKLLKSPNYYKILLINYLNKDGLSILMTNTYGNYFFQQLIKDSENKLISLIISYISDNFVSISKDSCGTFSMQALLDEISNSEEQKLILNEIKGHEMEMIYDKNATHVLQKLILLFPDNFRIELNQIILNNIKELCLDSNGICLFKNFIRSNTLLTDKKRINEEIIKNFVTLAESPFGNYGIQYLMENWDKDMLIDIKNAIIQNIYRLSLEQFSSNVIEKAIEIFDDEYREKIIKKLCFEENYMVLLKSKFGRFVLYKAIFYMKNDLRNEMEKNLIKNINNKIYNNKDKNKIKKLLTKINYIKNKSGNFLDNDNNYYNKNFVLNIINNENEINKDISSNNK